VKKRRATKKIETEPVENIEEKKDINMGRISHDFTSEHVSVLLEEFKCEIFQHSTYSTNLAPSDYHLFLYIKKFLSGQRLGCGQGTKQVLQNWLKVLATNFFEEGIQKLVTQ
jgi:hypothetical protein